MFEYKTIDNNYLTEMLPNENENINIHTITKKQIVTDCENTTSSLKQCPRKKFIDKISPKALVDVAVGRNSTLLEKISRVCRCCLIERNDLTPLFDEQNSIISIMMLLASVQIAPNDGLPQNICDRCLEFLTKTVHFRQQILNADMSLRHYIAEGYTKGRDLHILKLEQLAKTMSNNSAATIEKIDSNDQIYNISSEDENDLPIDHLFVQKPENIESVIISSNTGEELKKKFDDNIKHQKRIKTEVIEQINLNNYILEEVNLKQEMGNEMAVNEDVTLSEDKNIEPIDYFVISKTENSESIPNMEEDLKEKCDKPDSNVGQQESIKIEIFEQINFNDETSSKVNLEEEKETKKKIHENERPEERSSKNVENQFPLINAESDSLKSVTDNVSSSVSLISHDLKCQDLSAIDLGCHQNKVLDNDELNNSFQCEERDKPFTTESNLHIHGSVNGKNSKLGADKKQFVCLKCGKTYKELRRFNSHMKIHLEGKKYACDQCSKRFIYRSNLVLHTRTHTGEKPYVCNQCRKRFAQHKSLVEHIRLHTGEKPYACDQCSKRFTSQSTLVNHIRTHTGEKPYVCNICDKKFASLSPWKLHMRTHSDEKMYACDQCSKRFTQHKSLVEHIRIHTGEKPYVCDHCSKRFSHRTTFVNHLRTHTGEKPYVCNICDKKFATLSPWKYHIRTHSNEKLYACDQCSKRFTQHKNLVEHIRTHTGEKPYVCDQCSKRFTYRSAFIYHIRNHEKEIVHL